MPGLNCLKPDGGFYLFPYCSALSDARRWKGQAWKMIALSFCICWTPEASRPSTARHMAYRDIFASRSRPTTDSSSAAALRQSVGILSDGSSQDTGTIRHDWQESARHRILPSFSRKRATDPGPRSGKLRSARSEASRISPIVFIPAAFSTFRILVGNLTRSIGVRSGSSGAGSSIVRAAALYGGAFSSAAGLA